MFYDKFMLSVAVTSQITLPCHAPRGIISTISHTNKEDYRCYHTAQSNPTPWNS